jgi:cytochrome c-type biogenesis protein CcmH
MSEGKEKGDSPSRIGLAVLGVAALAAAAGLGYRAFTGGESDQPTEAVDPNAPLSLEQLEARAKANPLDSRAWQELALEYMGRERYEDAAKAWRQAIEGDRDNAALWSALGEARVYQTQSPEMPGPAVAAFEKALALDPTDPRARYFLAVRKDLQGDHAGAIEDWLALLADTPPGAPWEANLRQTIEQVGKINGIATEARIAEATKARPEPALTAGKAIPGPSQQQIAAASAIPPGEQRDMAESMVARLEGRLAADPKNVEGWVMLMRSRMTLGQSDKAAKALEDAVAANPGSAERLRQEAAALGVG